VERDDKRYEELMERITLLEKHIEWIVPKVVEIDLRLEHIEPGVRTIIKVTDDPS
jgi:hypothetical protein